MYRCRRSHGENDPTGTAEVCARGTTDAAFKGGAPQVPASVPDRRVNQIPAIGHPPGVQKL